MIDPCRTGSDSWWLAKLSESARCVERSGTVASRERARRAQERGVEVLPVMGSPREPLDPSVLEAVARAARDHVMPPAAGLPELRRALAVKLQRENGISADPESQILVTNGAKQALHVVLASLLEPGDEVAFPTPAYVFGGTIALVGGVSRPVPLCERDGYRWDPKRLERAITPHTKVLLLNTPANPTGFVAGPDDLRAVADVAQRHDLIVVVDEAYERLVYDGRSHTSLACLPEAADRTVTVFSLTKAHNLMGFRVGYVVGAAALIARATTLLEWMVLANNFLSQAAALAVLTGPQDWLVALKMRCEANRTRVSQALDGLEGLHAVWPGGGTAHFINVSGLGRDGEDLADRLLVEYGIPTAPGCVFGEADHLRLTAVGSRPHVVDELVKRLECAVGAMLAQRPRSPGERRH